MTIARGEPITIGNFVRERINAIIFKPEVENDSLLLHLQRKEIFFLDIYFTFTCSCCIIEIRDNDCKLLFLTRNNYSNNNNINNNNNSTSNNNTNNTNDNSSNNEINKLMNT